MSNGTIAALACAGAALAGAAPAMAQAGSAQGDVAITIYNSDLALVQDTRRINLPAGRSLTEFADVSAGIRPETVTISAPGVGVIEQNFDYDLLSPQRLVDKAVGQGVTVVRTNPRTGAETSEQARILANNGGTLVQIGNRIEVLGDMQARLVFDRLPDGLKARPTLSVALNAASGGVRPVALSYLSGGFGWKADYVALFDEAADKLDLQGWITLNNNSGTDFANAHVVLVAGGVNANGPQQPMPMMRGMVRPLPARGPASIPGTQASADEQLGDYHIYPLGGRTTLANAQQKQVGFLDVKGAAATRGYWYRNDWLGGLDEAASFATILRFAGGAAALPAGTVRVYMRDRAGQPQFIGADTIAHSPAGSQLSIRTGEAFDVKIQPVVETREKITAGEWQRVAQYRITRDGRSQTVSIDAPPTYWRTHMRYRLTNARATPVTVDVVQAGLGGGWADTRVSAESTKGEQLNADERRWQVTVPAHGEAVLTAQIDTSY
ncbi:MAG TPA: DUF4139 domain-containing protein [Novosphingobium sp.]|nr:DUF4139 domain-containing protein [Novosphingobium sp.]